MVGRSIALTAYLGLSVLLLRPASATTFLYNAVNDFDINHNPSAAVVADAAISNAWSYGVSPSMTALAANQFTYMNVLDRNSVRVDSAGNLLDTKQNGSQPGVLQQYSGPYGVDALMYSSAGNPSGPPSDFLGSLSYPGTPAFIGFNNTIRPGVNNSGQADPVRYPANPMTICPSSMSSPSGPIPTGWSFCVPSDQLQMHPGGPAPTNPDYQTGAVVYTVVRWVAPVGEHFWFSGDFSNLDKATADVHILLNGVPIYDEVIDYFNNWNKVSFYFDRAVNAGDVFDFVVGYGGTGVNIAHNGIDYSAGVSRTRMINGVPTVVWDNIADSVGFGVEIGNVPEPATVSLVSFGLVAAWFARRKRLI